MSRLDQRGTAAFEFAFVAVAFFVLIFAIFDLGRYLLTVQSLRTLAGAGARAIMIHESCFIDPLIKKQSPAGCPSDPLSNDQKKDVAPFLFTGGLVPALDADLGVASPITVTASQPGFAMIMPIWPSSFNTPTAVTKIPY